MATKVVTVDDLEPDYLADGKVEFGLDGWLYKIDLTNANAAALRDILDPYRKAGRKVKIEKKAPPEPILEPTASMPARTLIKTKKGREMVRAWAGENNWRHPLTMKHLAAQGRFPEQVLDAFDKAHGRNERQIG